MNEKMNFTEMLQKIMKIMNEGQELINSYEDIKKIVLETIILIRQLNGTIDTLKKIMDNVNKISSIIEEKLKK
jgi:hypothetical protein